VHRQPNQPSSSWPHLRVEIDPHAAGEDVAARSGIVVDSTLHRPKHARHLLPLVQQHRLSQTPQRHIRIRAERRRLGLAVQPNDRRGAPPRCRGLARGPRTGHRNRWQLVDQRREHRVDQSSPVLVHSVTLRLWTRL